MTDERLNFRDLLGGKSDNDLDVFEDVARCYVHGDDETMRRSLGILVRHHPRNETGYLLGSLAQAAWGQSAIDYRDHLVALEAHLWRWRNTPLDVKPLHAYVMQVADEVDRQRRKWGVNHDVAHTPGEWVSLLTSWWFKSLVVLGAGDADRYRIELAAMVVSAIVAHDARMQTMPFGNVP